MQKTRYSANDRTVRLATDAMLAAMYFVLTYFVTIRIANLRITLASLPIVVCVLLFGPVDACAAAAIGELLNQLLSYGLTATTPLWLLPPMLRAAVIGVAVLVCRKTGKPLERRPLLFGAVALVAAALTTLANTGITWLDSVLYGYFNEATVFGDFIVRFFTGLVTAIAVAAVSAPLVIALRRSGILPEYGKPTPVRPASGINPENGENAPEESQSNETEEDVL